MSAHEEGTLLDVWVVPGASRSEIVGAYGQLQPLKTDPVGFRAQVPPETASIVHGMPQHVWGDAEWTKTREADQTGAPMSGRARISR